MKIRSNRLDFSTFQLFRWMLYVPGLPFQKNRLGWEYERVPSAANSFLETLSSDSEAQSLSGRNKAASYFTFHGDILPKL